MGICQSSALKVTVFDSNNEKSIHYFTMKKMRTFETMRDVLSLINTNISPQDKLYIRNHIGLEEIQPFARFQIQDLIIKNSQRVFKYRIVMEPMY